jgi:hypothetical protein
MLNPLARGELRLCPMRGPHGQRPLLTSPHAPPAATGPAAPRDDDDAIELDALGPLVPVAHGSEPADAAAESGDEADPAVDEATDSEEADADVADDATAEAAAAETAADGTADGVAEKAGGKGDPRSRMWTPEEDERVKSLVEEHGTKRWSVIASHLPGRTGKQCRERWHNQLDPAIKKARAARASLPPSRSRTRRSPRWQGARVLSVAC